ncbi:NAD(P)H-hydrate epimerase [Rhodobacter viridis]|nr:NAD(P)H-hydrate epimerase [Rhodobacter viridis]
MTEILTSDEMRSLERAAIASGRISGLDLMERAGTGVVEAIGEAWPDFRTPADVPRHAVVLCGPGNNGGDGFVVARLLRRRGWKVTLYLYGDPERLPPDARTNHDRWRRIGTLSALPAAPDFSTADLVVDALFGLGLTRPLTGFGPIFSALATAGRPVLAIDLPSGRDADALPDSVGWPSAPCSLAVTFHREKPLHARLRAEGIGVIVKPIGL